MVLVSGSELQLHVEQLRCHDPAQHLRAQVLAAKAIRQLPEGQLSQLQVCQNSALPQQVGPLAHLFYPFHRDLSAFDLFLPRRNQHFGQSEQPPADHGHVRHHPRALCRHHQAEGSQNPQEAQEVQAQKQVRKGHSNPAKHPHPWPGSRQPQHRLFRSDLHSATLESRQLFQEYESLQHSGKNNQNHNYFLMAHISHLLLCVFHFQLCFTG